MNNDLTVVYDKTTSVIRYTLFQANPPKLGPNESLVVIPAGYARTFASFDECCRTIPQLAAGFDNRPE